MSLSVDDEAEPVPKSPTQQRRLTRGILPSFLDACEDEVELE